MRVIKQRLMEMVPNFKVFLEYASRLERCSSPLNVGTNDICILSPAASTT